MGAVMELIPRITALFIEGLKPISDATRELIAKKFKGACLLYTSFLQRNGFGILVILCDFLDIVSILVHVVGIELRCTGDVYKRQNKTGHPFIVSTQGMQIEVLGTTFNISAYPGEEYQATLVLSLIHI